VKNAKGQKVSDDAEKGRPAKAVKPDKNGVRPAVAASGSLRATIRRQILTKIISGEWQSGTRIASEHELVRQFGVSRMTVHHVLRDLQADGYLFRMQGMGTFVAQPRTHNTVIAIRNIADEVRARGGRYDSRILLAEKIRATREEADIFRLPIRSQLLHFVVLHLENDRPVQLENRLINPQAAPDLESLVVGSSTIFEHLMRLYPYPDGRHIVRARIPTASDAEILGLQPMEAVMEIERITWVGDLVVTRVILRSPALQYELRGEITRNEQLASVSRRADMQ
jgi:GntR family transcriptional regulator, histidine utilization repressor